MTLGKSRQQQKVLILSRFKFKPVVGGGGGGGSPLQ